MARQYNIFGFDKDGFRRDGFNRQGYDREGYSREGYDREGFNREGFNLSGFDREGYDRQGFNSNGFNRDGYDREGYSPFGYDREGYDRNGYSRTGYNRQGYDKDGYKVDGYNLAGYNRWGFDCNGFNAKGFDKDGYDREGYDVKGYDRRGFNKAGYNSKGYNREGYNAEGYDENDFDYAGYDKNGRDKQGYDRRGFNKSGIARSGTKYNTVGVDFFGFDREGYDVEGFDQEGYDRRGYDRRGYDRKGYDVYGFDCDGFFREGGRFDTYGADSAGCNKHGELIAERKSYYYKQAERFNDDRIFDLNGVNQRGFSEVDSINKNGTEYDVNGFCKNQIHRSSRTKYWLGYDCFGFDDNGYDRAGYNKEGFNSSGWTRDGHYKTGGYYDKEGYDWHGYSRYGLDKNGQDRNGISIIGLDSYGFNRLNCRLGEDKNGQRLSKIDSDGIDLYTLRDSDGFYRTGYDSEGYNRAGYDSGGFDRQGYGIDGYNKQGYDCKGFNAEGYDKDGYDATGFNCAGYDRSGFDEEGFDQEGYDVNGFGKNGYDKDGYDLLGFNMSGYDRDGFDVTGRDRNGETREEVKKHIEANKKKRELRVGMIVYHKRWGRGEIVGFLNNKATVKVDYDAADSVSVMDIEKFWDVNTFGEPTNEVERARSFDSDDDMLEKAYFKQVCDYIDNYCGPKARSNAMLESAMSSRVVSYIDNGEVISEISEEDPRILEVRNLQWAKNSPYFCHISYALDKTLYIGKKGYPQYIVDWADPKASMYYQYQMYIGKADIGLELVRDIDIENGYYLGYRDKYNKGKKGTKSDIDGINDEHLNRIIAANREDKQVHDIIQTIQNNQYNIITTDKRKNILVLGCAGSGKTMILLHKIRYMKYNDKDLDMKKIMVISPTNLLGRESEELARILQISDVQQETMTSMILSLAIQLLKENNCYSFLKTVSDSENNRMTYDIRSYEELSTICERVLAKKITAKHEFEVKEQNKLIALLNEMGIKKCGNFIVQEKYEDYANCVEELNRYSASEINHIILRVTRMFGYLSEVECKIDFLEYLLSMGIFAETPEKGSGESLFNILSIATMIDIPFLKEYVKIDKCTSLLSFIQNIMPFIRGEIEPKKLMRLIDEFRFVPKRKAEKELEELYSKREQLRKIPRQIDVLKTLNAEKRFAGKDSKRIISDEEAMNCCKQTIQFLNSLDWQSNNNTDMDIFEEYDVVLKRLERFELFARGEANQYLLDIIIDELGIERDKNKTLVNVNKNDVFEICFILTKLFSYSSHDERFIFIDEFQDFPKDILLFVKEIFAGSYFNMFGDFNQCINDSGMTVANSNALDSFGFDKYEIKENYRNSREITKYVNERFSMNMLPIGLNGVVEEKTEIELPRLKRGDRAVIIVANDDIASRLYTQLSKGKYSTLIYRYSDEHILARNGYTILPVIMAKGLEFEKVVNYEQGMTENQKYVACTRAIEYLQVVR